MQRFQMFWEISETIDNIKKRKKNSPMPRKYGTDDLLYMREIHAIQVIGTYEGLSLNELVDKIYRKKPTVSLLVNDLEQKGLIRKVKDKEDGRRLNLYLTDKGQTAFECHNELDKKEYGNFLKHLEDVTDEEFQIAQKVLSKIIKVKMQLDPENSTNSF